nr:phosphodiester glycosidase family protein [Nocardioides sp. MAH-18]
MTAGLVACVLAGSGPALAGDPRGGTDDRSGRSASGADRPQHTSDNQPGWIAPPVSARGRSYRIEGTSWQVVPGVTYSTWTQIDAVRAAQAHLLVIDPKAPGVRLDYADAGSVRRVKTVREILAVDGAVAGVNADFFDIGRTGAPLGLGQDRQRGLLHGRSSGWNSAFYLDKQGRPQIGELPMTVKILNHPEIAVTGLNQPSVPADSVGLYTRAWGRTAGYRMTQGQKKGVRAVWINRGKVERVRRALKADKPVTGRLLIGRGVGARQLAALKPGDRVRTSAWLYGQPKVAVTGNKLLVDDGVVKVADNRELHPRTAIGIDHDTGLVLMVVIDGRSESSSGYTMVDLANLMIDLGADEALNFDGGGSSTMVGTPPGGVSTVLNSPSDGSERRVTNALEVIYRPPAARH